MADGVGVGAGSDVDGEAAAVGSADAVAAVDEACSDLPLKAPATAKLLTSAMINRTAPPRNSRRRR
ncbi:hypothetical protein [Pseudarthrobacter sp. NCCP-2145]|uniref:hypothetical protein n=1 Tax=Pseudarthrobacter sp. NCCP-2145 TaxID=2942290 RepID=UPI0037CA879D